MRIIWLAISLAAAATIAIPAAARTETVLYSFDSYASGFPDGNLVRERSGALIGTASGSGSRSTPFGQVFMLRHATHSWTFTTLVKFNGQNGATPFRGVTPGANGVFYGTTMAGGAYGNGTVFELAKTRQGWTVSGLHDFERGSSDPMGRLLLNGQALYGTTAGGNGTAFALTKSGTDPQTQTLHKFGGSDGTDPLAGLTADPKTGIFYGTTASGGAYACGTVFALQKSGKKWAENVLYSFSCGTDGASPQSGVIEDSSGALYGTTFAGGNLDCGYRNSGCGTVFRLARSGGRWHETALYAFGGRDGQYPEDHDGLAMDANGYLYGTTTEGGANDVGVAFKLSPRDGTETVLHSFGKAGDGAYPQGGVILDPKTATLYGTTFSGGTYGYGTVYEVAP